MSADHYEFQFAANGWSALPKSEFWPYQMRNSRQEGTFLLDADANGFRQLALHFLAVAVGGNHAHLLSRDQVWAGSMFDAGVELTIGNDEYHGPDNGPQKTGSFRYEAKSVASSESPTMPRGARCETQYSDSFDITGNTAGLLSLAERCFDLAHENTPVGVAQAYLPGRQLTRESVPMVLRRL